MKWPLPPNTPIPSPAVHETAYWIGSRPTPPWIVLPPNAPPPSPAQTSFNIEIGTKEGERDLLRTKVGLESRTTIGATMSPSTVAPTSRTPTPLPIPSASGAVKTKENFVEYHSRPIISPLTQRSIPTPTSRAPAPSPIQFVLAERASTENLADYHSRQMKASPTQAPAAVPISRGIALPSSPTPSFSGAQTVAHAFPPSLNTPSPAQTSLNIEIGTKKVGRDLLRRRVGLESRTTIRATISTSTVARTSRSAPTPSPIPSASAAIKNNENVVHYHHLQPIISPPTQISLPLPTSRAPAPSPTPFVSAEQQASIENVPMNTSPTQAPSPEPSSPTLSFLGKRTLAHVFPPSSETPSPTPSALRAREATDETKSDNHFHSTMGPQAPAPSSDPRAPAPSSGTHTPPLSASISEAQRTIEKLPQYLPKPTSNGNTESLAPAPYAPTPTPFATPVPTLNPVVAATHGSTWARWWRT